MSEMHTHDTHLTPVLFRDGTDRRSGPRIPFERVVRVGPAYGAPCATVRAYDLSAEGIFIRGTRPAETGTTFSVELTLPSGQTIYIPEAEVLYNRTDPDEDLTGFAAKFTSLTEEVATIVESGAVFPSAVTRPDGGDVSGSMITSAEEHVTNTPLPVDPIMYPIDAPEVADLRLSIPAEPFEQITSDLPEPELAESALPEIPELQEDTDVMRMRQTLTSRKNPTRIVPRLRRRARRQGRGNSVPWTLLIAGGVTGLMVAAVLLSRGDVPVTQTPAARVAQADQGDRNVGVRGVRADTQAMLVGARKGIDSPVDKAPATRVAVPALVAPGKAAKTPAHRVAAKAPAPRIAAKAPIVRPSRPQKATMLTSTRRSPVATKPRVRPTALSIGVSPTAAVLRTHVLKSPPRFVIDLVGQDGAPKVPAASGSVSGIRVGAHPGYTRIVIDSAQVISAGTARRSGQALRIELSTRS